MEPSLSLAKASQSALGSCLTCSVKRQLTTTNYMSDILSSVTQFVIDNHVSVIDLRQDL